MNKLIDISQVVLITNRLTLRPWRESDLADFHAYAKVEGVGQMAGWKPHENMEESRRILGHFLEGKHVFALEHQGKVIGSVGIEPYNEENYPELAPYQGREIGYVLSKDYWGRGLMSEAVQRVIQWLFEEEKLDFILVGHFDWNCQSQRVIEKSGFSYVKTVPYVTQLGKQEQSVEYIQYRHDWVKNLPVDDANLVQGLYERFDEDSRLSGTQAGQVEFLTTVRYIDKYLKPGMRILDIGAGTGAYSLYFARKGFSVSSLELAEANLDIFRAKLTAADRIDLRQGNALDLDEYPDEGFDIVLLLGPLYHLHGREDRLTAIRQAMRKCKPGGKVFFAFISNDIVILTMEQYCPGYLLSGDYDKDTFKLYDFPFVFHTPENARSLLTEGGVNIIHEVASDGLSELLKDMVNGLDEASFQQYLRLHFYTCEKVGCLDWSNHLLFVGEK